ACRAAALHAAAARTSDAHPSAAHLQHGAKEKSVDAVEVDDERQPLAVLVEIAFELGRAVVDLPPHGFRIVDSPAAAEADERLRIRAHLPVEKGDVRPAALHGRENAALGIAHPDRELRVAEYLRAAAERQLRAAVRTHVRDAQHAAALERTVH